MLSIALFEPEIPPNTGNIIRLSANSGATLHLIKPLGFTLDNKNLKRAGLDYHDLAQLQIHENYPQFLQKTAPKRVIAFSTKGTTCYTKIKYQHGDVLLFGPETRGLPSQIRNSLPNEQIARIPMLSTSRSLNLSNSVAIAVYEAWRQLGFK